ncbi:MAG: type II toxin-antitoxin system prevent-host-death family antitoxin [Thiobacillaceae bacterium]|nr:type II toxin-antitoxin system prevent-host-death family antitoxin [Thiobacillaceae bacterium]MCX7672228.1 type II toxin-antitoxin system prevent-host-death family antitoxin [Thiobacillaceae bacterium]MDW8324496.1 type II toxin-antitoxin system prevent-host-death family antitoxin [Burkholderiales bacterium]
MKELTIREAREGLSHPERMFADADEILVVRRGRPVARILPVTPRRRLAALQEFLLQQPLQNVPSEVLLAQEREDRI